VEYNLGSSSLWNFLELSKLNYILETAKNSIYFRRYQYAGAATAKFVLSQNYIFDRYNDILCGI
jgi:hypothetical protein